MGDLDALALAFEGGINTARQRQFIAIWPRITRNSLLLNNVLIDPVSAALLPNLVLNGKPMPGPYQVERVLGKGAMGAVFWAWITDNQCQVAIKTMALSQAFDADALVEVKSRFFLEAETAGKLDYRNIVRIYGAREEGARLYRHGIYRGQRSWLIDQTRSLIAVGRSGEHHCPVADAHRNNVVHRDVKPANVMYGPLSGQVKVTDFGVARIPILQKQALCSVRRATSRRNTC